MAAYIISTLDVDDKEKFDQVYFLVILKQVKNNGGELIATSEKQQMVKEIGFEGGRENFQRAKRCVISFFAIWYCKACP